MHKRMTVHKVNIFLVGKLTAYLGCFNYGLRIGKMLLYQAEPSIGGETHERRLSFKHTKGGRGSPSVLLGL